MPKASKQLTGTGDELYDSLDDLEKNLIKYHRKNLKEGTFMEDNGYVTTLWETAFTGPDGKVHAVPGFVNGRKLDKPGEVEEYYLSRPQLLKQYPTYNSPEEAERAARARGPIKERDMERFRSRR